MQKKKKKKNQIFKILKRPLFDISEYAFKYLHDLHKGLRSEVPLNGFEILILFYILEWMY